MSLKRLAVVFEISAPLDSVWTCASDWRYWDEWWDSAAGFRPTTALTRSNGSRYAGLAQIAGITLNQYWEVRADVKPRSHGLLERR